MFITKKVFDPALTGKAVFIDGYDSEGLAWGRAFLIHQVNGEYLKLINSNGDDLNLHIENFDENNDLLKLQVLELPQQNVVEEKKEHKTGFTRNQGARNTRSDIQIKVDNAHVERILQENIEPLKLEEIMRRMQDNHGHDHWTYNNSSGFIKHAIKCGKRIKKVERGVYAYDWEAAK